MAGLRICLPVMLPDIAGQDDLFNIIGISQFR